LRRNLADTANLESLIALSDVAERWRLFASTAARSAEANEQSRAGPYVARLRARRASVGIDLLARLA